MTLPRRAAVLLACLLAVATAAGQSQPPAPFADDERAARVAERYRWMLAANPAEGMALDRLWKAYEERHATATLIEDYRHAAASDSPAALLVYGHLLKRAGRLDEAGSAYARASALDSVSPLPLVAQAELASVQARPAEAAALFTQALAKLLAGDRRRIDLLTKLGDAWLAANEPLKAVAAWEELAAADPNNLALRRQLAATVEKNGFPERAITQYEYVEAHADPAARAAALRELGRLHEVRGEFDAARDALERGLALTARDHWLHGDLQERLIRLYQRAGRVPDLTARWEAALAQNPRDLGGYTRLMALAEAEGDPVATRAWLEKFVALAPRDREASLRLARLLADAGEDARAAALYDALLRTQPGNLDLILARADLELRAGQVDAATRRVEARLAPSSADDTVSVPVLQFFLSHHLDDAAERSLRGSVARQPAVVEPSLALAKFYFARRRPAEAWSALEDLTRQAGEPAARAERWTAAAACYKDANEPDDALRCWQEAVALQPDASTPLLAIGEALLARGDFNGAVAAMERALAAAPEGAGREEIDRQLFTALSERSEPAPDPEPRAVVRGRAAGILGLPPGFRSSGGLSPSISRNTAAVPAGSPLDDYLAALDDVAREHPSAPAYARLARWLQWAHRPQEAAAAARALLALAPDNVPARAILAEHALAARDRPAAAARLREIAALDPAQKPAALGRVADLLMEENDFDGALGVLDGLAQEAPGSADALTALALGQQRADLWFDACATWERAYALPRLTPAQRANLRRPLLAAYEHLGRFPRAAELLQAAIDAQEGLAARQDLFRELVVFCRGHGLEPWLREQYQARLARQGLDYFTMTAMAELRRAAGEGRAAYDLLARAYYSAPDPPAALRALVAEAEALGEAADAVGHQRRLVALSGQGGAENLSKLAALEEADQDDDGASQTWEQVAGRFPRDTAALGDAADYFVRAGRADRARALLGQVVALDPADFRRTYQLGRLDAQAGDAAGAQTCFDGVLAHTRPERADDPLILPAEIDPATDASRFILTASRGAASEADLAADGTIDDKDERRVRLEVIGALSRMTFAGDARANAEARRRWLERWQQAAAAGARGEPLTAYYHAGQTTDAEELTASWLSAPDPEGTERAEGIYLLVGLRMGNYATLGRWAWEDGETDGVRPQRLTDSLRYFFATGGLPGPGMVAGLFPAAVRSHALLWGAATGVFADKRWYPQAVELGTRALALPGRDHAAESLQLAQWQVDLGQLEAARATLLRAVEESTGAAYDATANNAVFSDLRAYYYLLPAAARPGFVGAYLGRARARGGSPVHAILAGALLHGLAGEDDAARRDLDEVVRMRLLDGSPGAERWTTDQRRWNYLYACGGQLQAWSLDGLAAYLWRRALSESSAFDRLDTEVHGTLAEIRLRQLTAEVMTAADPQESSERVAEFLRDTPAPVTVAQAATALVRAGQYPEAIQIYGRLGWSASLETDASRSLLIALDAAGDTAAVERALTEMLSGPLPPGGAATRLETVNRLATLRENTGDPDGAIRLLQDTARQLPRSTVVGRTLAQVLERQGRAEDAAAVLREAGSNEHGFLAQEALASLELRRGNREAAYALAREARTPDSEAEGAWWTARRVELFLLAGHSSEAVDLARTWVHDGRTAGVVEAANSLAAHGQRPAAREVLVDAIGRARDPQTRYGIQAAFIKIFCTGKDVPAEAFLRELRRLERFSRAAPGQAARYVEDRAAIVRARGESGPLEADLRRQWRDGAGDIAAADGLGRLYLDERRWEPLRSLVAAIEARPNLPETILSGLAQRLVKAGQAPVALGLSERLQRRFPQNPAYALLRARALWESGRREEAAGVLDALDASGIFRESPDAPAAALWLELGQRDRARASLQAALERDPSGVRSAVPRRRLVALDAEDKRLDQATGLFISAYRDPAAADLGSLVESLEAAGQLTVDAAGSLPGGELPLTFVRRAQLLAGVCGRLQTTGHADAAWRLALAHPELFPAVPTLVASLRQTATPAQLPALASSLREALRQALEASPRLQHELARTLARAAETPVAGADATNLLTEAYELAPDEFAVARPLAEALRRQGQQARALEVLKPFLAAGALPSERNAARQTLGLN